MTEKKIPHKKNVIKNTKKNYTSFSNWKKKSVVDKNSIHSNFFCVFCLCLFRNFLWSSIFIEKKKYEKLRKLKKKNILVILHLCKNEKKDISIKNVFFGNIAAKFPYCVLYTTPINTFYELFAFSLCFFLPYFLQYD